MTTRRSTILTLGAAIGSLGVGATAGTTKRVRITRLPEGALQPQLAQDASGKLHLVTFHGEPQHGDLLYAFSRDEGATFSRAIPVNREPGSAIATGTIRGAQVAAGRKGRVHVAWDGSKPTGPVNADSGKRGMPMLYTRMSAARDAFEPQRNLMHHSFGLDGGGSVAADRNGNVYVAWHGVGASEASQGRGEARRRVWITRSRDGGATFETERMAWAERTGACGCCGLKIHADGRNRVYALYRSATESVHRDIYLLKSDDQGASFEGRLLHKWDINACPMSSMDLADNGDAVMAAWETGGQVYWVRVDGGIRSIGEPIPAPGAGKGRKHPRIAVNSRGETLLIWTEGTGWKTGGSLAYQLFDERGKPGQERGQLPGIAAWSFGAVTARPDGSFLILY
ncbi:MAG: exo-alpha-sialidase [Bryobacterales bacterium]|nr:exo-alpha-sialidase [Bryobacterales bacterium]